MLVRFLNSHADRSVEWLSALAMLNWCLILAQPGNTYSLSPSFAEFTRYGLTEDRLALLFGVIGSARVVALVINGKWPRSPVLRIAGAMLGGLIWGQIAWLQYLGSAASGAISTGVGIYALLAVAEIANVYRAAFDARYHRR